MTFKTQFIIRLCFIFSAPLSWQLMAASTPLDAGAVQANLAFQDGADSGLSPMTPSEMAMCHAYWDRWKYVVDSSNVPAFNNSLRPELSSKSTTKTAIDWLRKSRKEYRSYGDGMEGFAAILADANENADAAYSRYMGNDPKDASSFANTLGTCRLAK